MTLKVFAIHNKPYDRIEGCWVSPSAGLAIRDNSQFLARVSPHFTEDLELLEIGSFSDDSDWKPISTPILHSWEEYKKPEVDISDKKSE